MAQSKNKQSKRASKQSAPRVDTGVKPVRKRRVGPASPPPPPPSGWQRVLNHPKLPRYYLLFAGGVLLGTTTAWAYLGSRLQLSNADQLVDPFLFQTAHILHNALFPGAHSFLVKWPLFWLISRLHYATIAYMAATIGVVLATIGSLAYLLYRIARRPLIVGSLWFALASVLLATPAQPYPGGLLPVNMAMLETRNLEYVLLIGSLVLLIRARQWRSRSFWLATGLAGLLIASDKLFIILTLGGGLIGIVLAGLAQRWSAVKLASRWLISSLLAVIGAQLVLWLLQTVGLAHFVNQTGTGPYGTVQSVHNLLLGSFYAVFGGATILGANPAHTALTLRSIPHVAASQAAQLGVISYAFNFLIVIAALVTIWKVAARPLLWAPASKPKATSSDQATQLLWLLCWASLAALASFVLTNHYYVVDARYLAILVFTAFVALALYGRQTQWTKQRWLSLGAFALVASLAGLSLTWHEYHGDRAALTIQNNRDSLIAQALNHHQPSILVGDYWRVVPISYLSQRHLPILPLASCTEPRTDLTSLAWQPDLERHSFAYLLTLDGSLTGYPNCSLPQVINAYGRPTASALVAGSLSKPRELLLFYDHGIQRSSPVPPSPQSPATVVPINLNQLGKLVPALHCQTASLMTVVAHEDDDLLFMNPDVLHHIQLGDCVRTIYVTAGDAGSDKFYWLSREQGSEAAYAKMAHANYIWVTRIIQLGPRAFASIATPRQNPKISLIFMHLPDGNLSGQGFKATGYESLQKLDTGKLETINSVDGQSAYTASELTTTFVQLLDFFKPTTIFTQANFISQRYPDHSDHMAVGRFMQHAYQQYYNLAVPMSFYIGYPIHQLPPNVVGSDLQAKEAVYFAYAQSDAAVCKTELQCDDASTFGKYLNREYQNPY